MKNATYNQSHPWLKYKNLKNIYKGQLSSLSNKSLLSDAPEGYEFETRKKLIEYFLNKFDDIFFEQFKKDNGYDLTITRDSERWKEELEKLNKEDGDDDDDQSHVSD